MKLKLDDAGNVVVTDGKPVYVHDDGKEIAFDAAGTVATISRLNHEAKTHREAKEAAEAKITAFADLDPEKARQALKTLQNLDDKKLVDAGEVDKMKADAIANALRQFEADKYRPVQKKVEQLEQQIREEKIGNAFARSKYIAEKLAVPSDIVQARFGHHLKIEDGKVIGYDMSGNRIFSRTRPGEPAEFDEVMETIVEQYPYKENILKGTGAQGTGAKGSAASGGAKTMTRAQFDAMPQHERAQRFKDGYVVV